MQLAIPLYIQAHILFWPTVVDPFLPDQSNDMNERQREQIKFAKELLKEWGYLALGPNQENNFKSQVRHFSFFTPSTKYQNMSAQCKLSGSQYMAHRVCVCVCVCVFLSGSSVFLVLSFVCFVLSEISCSCIYKRCVA